MMNGSGLPPPPGAAVLLCNRAAVRMKLQLFSEAVLDAEAALHSVPSFQKAEKLHAQAQEQLKSQIKEHRMFGKDLEGKFKLRGKDEGGM